VPIAHAIGLKVTYETMSLVLNAINQYLWFICGNLTLIGLLLGLQGGFTKYCCFFCLWNNRSTDKNYRKKRWPERNKFIPGKQNVTNTPLVLQNRVILPPLHIKLGLMKNFVKALNKEGDGFKYLITIFHKLSDAKLKEGIFVGP